MLVTVKSGLLKKLFLDENRNLLALLLGQGVLGPDRTPRYKTGAEGLSGEPVGKNRRYVLTRGGVLVAAALPVYAADADHFAIPRPPRPVGLSVRMGDGAKWQVKRVEQNSAVILTPDGTGRLSDFFAIGPQTLEIPDGSCVPLWAGVYALIGYMLREDEPYFT